MFGKLLSMTPTPTPRVRRTWAAAEAEANRRGHDYLGTEHLLLALLADRDGIAGRVLGELGVAEEAGRQLRAIMDSPEYSGS